MQRYNPKKIEKKWAEKWEQEAVYEPDMKKAKRPFYNLMMFPYPSAEGLHVGNMYAFVGADIYGRKKRMEGNDVFEPIGLDGFGIHSENYALKIGAHPMKLAEKSEKNFYKQLQMIGNGFAWNERLETYNPEYYRWTQWVFVQMFKQGLAYRKKAKVNWCPGCKTVLSDEQVIAGACERCDSIVIKKELEQWFFKITDYAKRLLGDLEKIDWSEKVKIAQKNWIGESEGARITFALRGVPGHADNKHSVEVFTTRPDTLFGVTFIAISAELAKRWIDAGWQASPEVGKYIEKTLAGQAMPHGVTEKEDKTGIDAGFKAIHPITGEAIPVWVVNYVLGDVGTGAIMAVPAHDQRDFEFAKKFNLPAIMVVCPHYPAKTCPVLDEAYTGEGHMIASGEFNGQQNEQVKWGITKKVGGERITTYRLRDWLISRQRYWGPPIPMVFCEACKEQGRGERDDMPGWYTVPVGELPVELPYVKNFKPTGEATSPLAAVSSFYEVDCPACGTKAQRETDVSDTFLDSAWYYLRYPSVTEKNAPWNADITKNWLPVDMYIGGAEHAVLHLLYTRFLAKAFFDWKLIDFDEPFVRFRAHGLLIKDGAKMSKSRGNVINPDVYIKAYGADAFRMYLMFLGPFEQGGDFRDEGIKGVTRFLERMWNLAHTVAGNDEVGTVPERGAVEKILHQTIKKVTEDIELLNYNTAISQLMILLREYENNTSAVAKEDMRVCAQLLAPFAPFLAEELWYMFGGDGPVHVSSWPLFEESKIQEDAFELVVQINGKMRDKFQAPSTISKEDMEKEALSRPRVQELLAGKQPKKVIIIPKRLVNIVL
ncbi:MAG: leucine--tRNA ligase [Candidatus Niyogibacteria bacterium CG10_big_fil_rev_8_21_14_0_10_46_36]|uniref:Leucine--tRNA ligase n=1 Tax=Candidatus Niyogibacteria bacterium CG10_big_fil_rev_8_21_14_0_10_46_36 TaxID=1974726 RepID=A0A2H0TEM8_9BACT|nr:MAG: leucine--tRNA ligase [Candidatus Niyogibacteria bacterium CG10_big_fil_rev_8_21_14_0_10_46_36]